MKQRNLQCFIFTYFFIQFGGSLYPFRCVVVMCYKFFVFFHYFFFLLLHVLWHYFVFSLSIFNSKANACIRIYYYYFHILDWPFFFYFFFRLCALWRQKQQIEPIPWYKVRFHQAAFKVHHFFFFYSSINYGRTHLYLMKVVFVSINLSSVVFHFLFLPLLNEVVAIFNRTMDNVLSHLLFHLLCTFRVFCVYKRLIFIIFV